MYFLDHDPPHIHIKYKEFRAKIAIQKNEIIDGMLPKRATIMVCEWIILHKKELIDNWYRLQKTGEYKKIKPLS